MTSESDDALSWDGDETAPARPMPRRTRAEREPVAAAAPAPEHARAPEQEPVEDYSERAPLSSTMLVVLGVVGGVYLLYSIGWVVGGLRLKPLANFFVTDAMFLPWFVLAVAAPALWMLVVWVLTRGRAAWIRIALLLLGVVLLVPWPFVTVGVIGS